MHDPDDYRLPLFTLRFWFENSGDGESEWRGRLHHVPSGQDYYFRDWNLLVPLLRGLLGEDVGTARRRTQRPWVTTPDWPPASA